jgi:hypothetical protein
MEVNACEELVNGAAVGPTILEAATKVCLDVKRLLGLLIEGLMLCIKK